MAAAPPKPNEITIIREYDAPIALVWEAWTDPKKIAKWWGPRGFTLTTHSKDLRPGGHWHYTMHGPDGKDWPNKTKYFEVEKQALLVYDHGGNDERAPLFRVTARFAEIAKGKTRLEMTMTLPSEEAAKETKKFIKLAGGDSTWDRLAEYIADGAGKEAFVINRSFDAPREEVFRMWTDPERLAHWLAPAGMTMRVQRGEIRAGSELFFSMTDGASTTLYGSLRYLEIDPPRRLSYLQQFRDEKGGVSRHPHAPIWPETLRTTVRFETEWEGRTRVTVTWEPEGANATELAAFRDAKPGMTGGWTGSFDKLEALLGAG